MPKQSSNLGSSFVAKSEVSCFKLKGEDYHFAHTSERAKCCVGGCPVSVEYAIAGVLDGHGGKKAAEFSSKQVTDYKDSSILATASETTGQIPSVLSSLIHKRIPDVIGKNGMDAYSKLTHVSEEQQRLWALQDAVVEVMPSALRDTFIKVNDDFLAKEEESGTTATVVVLCGSHVITANVGDSLAYADLGARVQQLTSSHRIDENTSEQRRIEASGGELGQAALDGKPVGPLRVWPGGLAFSRSLGDRHAGERVLAEPEVSQMLLDDSGARIILASDGLWDVLTGKSAAHRVRTVACSKAAARLRSVAKEKRDRDDITVIVIDALEDSNSRIPAAIALANSRCQNATSSAVSAAHQLWNPLACSEHRWKDQWSYAMQARCPVVTEKVELSEKELPGSVDGSTCEQTTIPALLYEEVHSSTSSVGTAQAAEGEWMEVPSKNASSRIQSQHKLPNVSQQDDSASLNTNPSMNEDRQPRRNDTGRGRGRGRNQSRFGGAGRGRGRGQRNPSSNNTASADAGVPNNTTASANTAVTSMELTGASASVTPGSNDAVKGAGNTSGRRRNAGKGRHACRKSAGHAGRHSRDGPNETRVSLHEVFPAC